jgi:2-octaprenyl-6-methoxyphenol hydroxylase
VNDRFDILIIGSGLVGGTLACALADQPLRIGIVEAKPVQVPAASGYDDRTIALAHGSRRILEGVGLWGGIEQQATSIHRIHVSDRGQFGSATLEAADQGVAAFGYVVTAQALGGILLRRLQKLERVVLLCPAQLSSLRTHETDVEVEIKTPEGPRSIRCGLLVAADGASSRVRELIGVGARRWTYGQHAITANLTPERPHRNTAFERFTDSGPLALLPLDGNRCALVCTVWDEQVGPLMELSDVAFRDFVQDRFGERLSRIVKVGRRHAHPLSLVKSRQHVGPRTAIIGNAAHTLHPVAGQGLNLGLRDVASLAEVLVDSLRAGDDFGAPTALGRYAEARAWDQRWTAGVTDGLARVFANPLPPIRLARSVGLMVFDLLPPAKRMFGRAAMGASGRQTRLARGLPL